MLTVLRRVALLFILGASLAAPSCPLSITITIATPLDDSTTCDTVVPVEVEFSEAVDPSNAELIALLVSGIDSSAQVIDVSSAFSITPTGAAAVLPLEAEGRYLLSVSLDATANGRLDGSTTIEFAQHPAEQPLLVESISPPRVGPGQSFVVYGQGFCPERSGNTVLVDGTRALVESASSFYLRVLVPAEASGSDASLRVGPSSVQLPLEVVPSFAQRGPTQTDADSGFLSGEISVFFSESTTQSEIQAVALDYGIDHFQHYPDIDRYRAVAGSLDHAATQALAESLEADDRVRAVALNGIMAIARQIAAPVEIGPSLRPELWHLPFSGFNDAWLNNTFPSRGSSVPIVVIDSGVAPEENLEELDVDLIDERTFVGEPSYNEKGCQNHGSYVASIAASSHETAEGEESEIGGVGVAPRASIVSFKVREPTPFLISPFVDDDCYHTTKHVEEALQDAFLGLPNRSVVNLSLSTNVPLGPLGPAYWSALLEVLATLRRVRSIIQDLNPEPPIVVMAMDNNGEDFIDSLARSQSSVPVIAVGSIARPGVSQPVPPAGDLPAACQGGLAPQESVLRACFSNYGDGLDVVAPGTELYATDPIQSASFGKVLADGWGNSFAAPQVAGLLAMILAEFPELTTADALDRLLELFVRPPDSSFMTSEGRRCHDAAWRDRCVAEFGAGLIDAKALLSHAGAYRLLTPGLDHEVARVPHPNQGLGWIARSTGTWIGYHGGVVSLLGRSATDDVLGESCVSADSEDARVHLVAVGATSSRTKSLQYVDPCLSVEEGDISELFTEPGIYRVYASIVGAESSRISTGELWIAIEHPWPGFLHDSTNAGRSLLPGPRSDTVLGTYPRASSSNIVPISAPTIDAGGVVYLVTLDPSTSTTACNLVSLGRDWTREYNVRWSSSVSGCSSFAPAIGIDGTVFVLTGGGVWENGSIHAFSPDGQILWSHNERLTTASPLLIGRDGNLYFVGDRSLYSYSPRGERRFERFLDLGGRPAIAADGTILVTSRAGQLIPVEPTGDVRPGLPVAPGRTPTIAGDGSIILNDEHSVFVLEENGSPRWSRQLIVGPESTDRLMPGVTVGPSGRIYVRSFADGREFARLFALTPNSEVSWERRFEGSFSLTEAIVDDSDTLYLALAPWQSTGAGESMTLMAVGADGATVWEKVIGGDQRAHSYTPPAAISSEGRLFAVGSSDLLFVFGPAAE